MNAEEFPHDRPPKDKNVIFLDGIMQIALGKVKSNSREPVMMTFYNSGIFLVTI